MPLKVPLIFVVFVAGSCMSRSTSADVDGILAGRNYTFEFSYQGCFGGGTETLEIKDREIVIYTYPVYGETDRVNIKIDTLPWTKEKEVILREICMAGIQLSDTSGLCTTTTRYELKGLWSFVTFTDNGCALIYIGK